MAAKNINIDFITTENIEMIWEIIFDDIKDGLKSQEQISKSRSIFINDARLFFEREKNLQQNLMQMNKKFISEFMKKFNNLQMQPMRMQRKDDNKPILFKSEDIQAERLNAFEKGLAEKKNDFMNAMSIPIPETPKFSDIKLDEPIGSAMGELIARTLAQRNFEIEELHKSSNKDDVDRWLKPTETSIKNDKVQQKQQNDIQIEEKQKQYQYKHQTTPKFIQIGDELPTNKKQISWGKNKEYEFNEINLEVKEIENKEHINDNKIFGSNIFSKLKYVNDDNVKQNLDIESICDRLSNVENKITEILYLLKNKN
jgi:hypothetical protein